MWHCFPCLLDLKKVCLCFIDRAATKFFIHLTAAYCNIETISFSKPQLEISQQGRQSDNKCTFSRNTVSESHDRYAMLYALLSTNYYLGVSKFESNQKKKTTKPITWVWFGLKLKNYFDSTRLANFGFEPKRPNAHLSNHKLILDSQ